MKSSGTSIYLDNNATTAVLPEVKEAVVRVLESGALNPSSIHSQGDRARALLEEARESVAHFLGADAEQVVFTSGATEANHLVLRNLQHGAFAGFRLVTTTVEHSSVREALPQLEAAGIEVVVLPVGRDGRVDPNQVAESIESGRTLVSVHWANNETGVIQPMSEIATVCRDRSALLHSDAVQATGKIEIDFRAAEVEVISISSHKLHGPPGAGALVLRNPERFLPQTPGGGQEGGIRPGTENLPAIVGMGEAYRIRRERFQSVYRHTRALRDEFEGRLRSAGVIEAIAGETAPRLPNTTNVRVRGVDGEAVLLQLNRAGIACSQSSACTNRKPEPSFVLRAMGLSEDQAFRSLRFGFSELNTPEEVDRVIDFFEEIHTRLIPLFAERPVA